MTTQVRIETIQMPVAAIGPENPLPFLTPHVNEKERKYWRELDPNLPEKYRKYYGYGLEKYIMPYRMQDGYDRNRKMTDVKTAVLENETMKAVFLLEYGGRLWSLIHKPTGSELLHNSPFIQPVNVSRRNAWFGGGIEWNGIIQGHSALTCDKIFAAKVTGSDGTDILRLYEYHRMRQVPYMMDFYFVDDLPFLFTRVSLFNPYDEPIPMYWFTNAAVVQKQDVRTIVPTTQALYYGYASEMTLTKIPFVDGIDSSYATLSKTSTDYFYVIPENQVPWEVSLNANGEGLANISTSRLIGRKMFVWGTSPGGNKWQDFINGPDNPYMEIQSGITLTQNESTPMEPKSRWSWIEAWGYMSADSNIVHGDNWQAAVDEVQENLYGQIDPVWLEAELKRTIKDCRKAPDEILFEASGWGSLEDKIKAKFGKEPFSTQETPFPETSIGEDEKQWQALLEDGYLPCRTIEESPGSFMVGAEWLSLLEKSIEEGKSDNWFGQLHMGIMYHEAQMLDKAENAFNQSIKHKANPWAYFCLSTIATHAEEKSKAIEYLFSAIDTMPDQINLLLAAALEMVNAGQGEKFMEIYNRLNEDSKNHPRIKVWRAKAALESGDIDTAEEIINSGIELADVRECETTLSDIWFSVHEKRLAAERGIEVNDEIKELVKREYKLPQELDFRMSKD